VKVLWRKSRRGGGRSPDGGNAMYRKTQSSERKMLYLELRWKPRAGMEKWEGRGKCKKGAPGYDVLSAIRVLSPKTH